jgi:hypothetical protein
MSDRKISEIGIYQNLKYLRKSAIILLIFGIFVALISSIILTHLDSNGAYILIIVEVIILSFLPIVMGASNLIIIKKAKYIDNSRNPERTVTVNSSIDHSIKYLSFIEYTRACPSCGMQLEDDAIFCTKCGAK